MNQRTRPLLALLGMSLIWGYGWTVLKFGLLDAEPFDFNAARMSLSTLCLFLLVLVTGRPLRPKRVPELIILGLGQTTLLFTFSTWAIDSGNVGRVAFLVYTMPLFTVVLAWPFLGERIHGFQWVSVFLATFGLILLVRPWENSGSWLGNTLSVGAGITWAVGAIMIKRFQKKEPMDLISMTAWQMAFGTIPLLFLAWYIPETPIVWSSRFIFMLAIISIAMTAAGWCLWIYALDRLDAGTASLGTLIAPIIAVVTAAIHFGELPLISDVFGMAAIATALLTLSLHTMRDMKPTK